MNAATDKELSELHSKVAKVLLQKLDSVDKAILLIAKYEDELPEEVVEYLAEQSNASPALLTVVTKFLKDNDITAVVEESKELTDLEKRLQEKRKRRVGNVSLVEDE